MGERRWEQSRGRGAEQQMKFVQTRSVRKRYKGQSGLSPLSAVRSSPFALHSPLFTFRSPHSSLHLSLSTLWSPPLFAIF